MSDNFALGTYSIGGGSDYVAFVIGERLVSVEAANWVSATSAVTNTHSLFGLLQDRDRNFGLLQELHATVVREEMAKDQDFSITIDSTRPLPPVKNLGKMLYAGANYRRHVKEMSSMGPGDGPDKEPSAELQPFMF